MIISASRRTDIPAFYTDWLTERLRAGYCIVPNPVRPDQESRISLRPGDVDALVFWTRNAAPLLPHLDELDAAGYRCYFLYTVLDYPRELDPFVPPAAEAVRTVRALAARVGPERIAWRYDPIVFSNRTDAARHVRAFGALAQALAGATQRCIVSLVDPYRKAAPRLRALADNGLHIEAWDPGRHGAALAEMARLAARHGMQIQSCAEHADLEPFDIPPGKCVDDAVLLRACGVKAPARKDPSQRKACRCVASRDIGMYDTCVFGCRYCYATSGLETARRRHAGHSPRAERLV